MLDVDGLAVCVGAEHVGSVYGACEVITALDSVRMFLGILFTNTFATSLAGGPGPWLCMESLLSYFSLAF